MDEYNKTAEALRHCAEGKPCGECPRGRTGPMCDLDLKKEAANAIEKLTVLANNYKKALDALEVAGHENV